MRAGLGMLIVAGFAGGAFCPAMVGAETRIVLTPSQDNTLFEDAEGDTSNGAGPVFFAGQNSQGVARRAVLAFDVAGAVPPGARIVRAELVLTVTNAPNEVAVTMSLHRLARTWGEGTSSATGGSGATATTGDATWLHAFYPDVLWTEEGGDFGAPRASASVPMTGTASWTGTDLADDVQAWLDTPEANHGWLLKSDESTSSTARRFASREASEASQRPTLTIDYIPFDQVRTSTWGVQKSRWKQE